jgi:preprotein translocase subunit YajC
VSSIIPFVIFIVVIVGLLAFSARARRRQAQVQLDRAERIAVGTEVMTTSGLYGTVVARNDDDSVLLSIAPGVEVRWALAALRDLESLPREYRGEPDEAGADADVDDAP